MSRVGRVAAAATSLAATIATFVVAPLALVAASSARFGSASPLSGVSPWEWELGAIEDTLAEPLGDDALADVLIRGSLCVAWLALAVVLWSTVAEVVHLVRHRGMPRRASRGLGWAQPIARVIAAGIVAFAPTTGRHVSAASPGLDTFLPSLRAAAEVAAPLDDGFSSTASPPSQGEAVASPAGLGRHATRASDGPHYHEVVRGDSVWSIAASLAGGDDERTLEIADAILDANLDRIMTDGQRFSSPALISPGWMLVVPDEVAPSGVLAAAPSSGSEVVPAPATAEDATHTVVAGETLSSIAASHLGDPSAWPAIYEANAGARMSDGRVFDDPDLIVPGWTLRIPAGTDAPDDVALETPNDVADEPSTESSVDDEGPGDSEVPGDTSAPTYDPPDPVVVGPFPASDPSPASTDDTTPTISLDPEISPTGTTPATTAPSTTTTSVPPVDAGEATDAGRTDPTPIEHPAAPSPIRVEHAAMLAAGVLAIVGARRLRRLRRAMPRSRVPTPPADVVAAERDLRAIEPGEGVARLDIALRALGRRLAGTGSRIGMIRASADGRLVVRLSASADVGAPWAGHGQTWELSARVPIEMLAADARVAGQPCHALVEVGRTEDGDRLVVDLEVAGLTAIEARAEHADDIARSITTGLASSPYAEVAEIVTSALGSASFVDHPNAHCVESPGRVIEEAIAARNLALGDDATTFDRRVRQTGGELWEPTVVVLGSGDEPTEILAATGGPVGARGVAVVAAGIAPCPGGPRPGVRIVAHADRWELVAFGESLVFEPIGLTESDLVVVNRVLDEANHSLVHPEVSDDAAVETVDVPFVVRPHEIVVGVLGGVEIRSRSGESGVFERSKTVELLAWLATHRDRATRAGARTALWEIDVRDATFANVVSEARRALGRLVDPPEGEEWVARTLTESLPLHDLVVTDADLVRDRLDHARSAAPAHAVDVLEPAVELIREMPFAGTSYLWPDADGITSDLVLLATTATAELAAHALSMGDTERVFSATSRGLRVLPGHEELIALRMRAHARSGDLAGVRAEWESYERVIVGDAWSDGEPAPKLVALRHELLAASA